MRKIDFRIPAVAGVALIMLAVAPAAKAEQPAILFVPGTGEAALADTDALPAPVTRLAGAEDRRDTETRLNDMARDLADPRVQDGVADMVERIGETVLDLPVGKFAAAVERARPGTVSRRVREDATVADLAGRDADRLPRELGEGSRQMMSMFSGFAAAFAGMMPAFEDMARDLEASMRDIKAARD